MLSNVKHKGHIVRSQIRTFNESVSSCIYLTTIAIKFNKLGNVRTGMYKLAEHNGTDATYRWVKGTQ